jgi:CheY-like chemotaxis protein
LVVEGNPAQRRVAAALLRRWGMHPVECESGAAAVRAVEASRYRVALVDTRLPDMESLALVRKLREAGEPAPTPILLVRVSEYPPEGFVSVAKPLDPSDVRRALERVLGVDPGFPRAVESSVKAATLPANWRPLRILLAEDNPVNQKLVVRLLEKRGHAVVVAPDGRRAIELWRREPFDLILMDVQMPDMSGLDAASAIRRDEKNGSRIPIVALTAHVLERDRERCLEAGMDDHLAKPIQPQELYAKVEAALEPAPV